MTRTHGAFAVGLLAATAMLIGPVPAQDTREWSQVGHWSIAVDPTLNNSCFALNEYDDGTVLRIGLDLSEDDGIWYIMFGNDRWQSIEAGSDYDVSLKFDREAEWNAVASGIDMGGGVNFLYVFGSDVNFFDEFVRKNTLKLFYDGSTIAQLSLSGSARAINAMLECQEAQEAAPPADPFAGKTKKKSGSNVGADPFAN